MRLEGEAPARTAHLCPLCGQANRCAMAAGNSNGCWCVGAAFSAELLLRAASSAGAVRCICVRCATRSSATTTPETR
jgi:hypothetical protein